MAINIRGHSDAIIDKIVEALAPYEIDHPHAAIELYRQNPVSVRIRIVDPEFSGKSKPQRSQDAWAYLEHLPEAVQSDISTVLLLTPDETKTSFANFEFDDPIPSKL
jgi:stress-induced morphogen